MGLPVGYYVRPGVMTIPLDPEFSSAQSVGSWPSDQAWTALCTWKMDASEMLTAAACFFKRDPRFMDPTSPKWDRHKIWENPCYHPIFYPILTGLENHVPWLVVYLPLWKIWVRQLGWWHSQYDVKVTKFHGSKPPSSSRYFPYGNMAIFPNVQAPADVTWHWSHRHNSPKSRAPSAALFPARPHGSHRWRSKTWGYGKWWIFP